MKYCLVKEGKAFEGDSYMKVVSQITDFSIDYEKGTLFIGYKNIGKDTISYSKEFSKEEIDREAAQRIVQILLRDGWALYRGG